MDLFQTNLCLCIIFRSIFKVERNIDEHMKQEDLDEKVGIENKICKNK
jgi:hypothetical protein